MRQVRYDFSEFESIMYDISVDGASNSLLNNLKIELNQFFNDSKCKEVIYTQNTDKLFFGMSVIPVIQAEDVEVILQDDGPYRIKEYYLEFDSKLFDPVLNLTPRELVAILLHEVGHLVADTKPIDDIRKSVDTYLAKNDEVLVISNSIHYQEILAFAIKDSLRKFISLFEFKDEEIIADEFVAAYGYGKELESAFDKLIKSSRIINRNVNDKLVVLSWTLRLYKDIKLRRIPAIRTLNKGKQISPSRLEKREFENVIRRLNRIDDDALMEGVSVLDSLKGKYNETLQRIKYKGIRSLEDDLYEYNVRIKNLDDDEDALYILRQINQRMAIIDDYIATERSISDEERQRWFDLNAKYQKLREQLTKTQIYKNRYVGIHVSYPDIKPNNY